MKLHAWIGLGMIASLCACGQKQTASSAEKNESSGNPVTAPVDYLGAVSKAKRSAETRLDTVALTQAIQFFHAQEGRYPRDLNELVSKRYLAALPTPPSGSRITYNPASGEVRIVRQ